MRLFLYEYATAQSGSVDLPASVRREGAAMFAALREDAARLPGVEVLMLDEDEDEGRFRDVARRADWALIVAPEFDGILEARCLWVEESGGRLLGPSSEGVRRTADKYDLYRHWVTSGVPTPATWAPSPHRREGWGEGAAVDGLRLKNRKDEKGSPSPPAPPPGGERGGSTSPGPSLVRRGGRSGPSPAKKYLKKHRYGAGSLGIEFLSDPTQVEADHVIQEWVPGVVASVGLIVDARGGVVPLAPGRQIMSEDGLFCYLGGQLPLEEPYGLRLQTLGKKAVAGVPGLRGYVGVDAIVGESGDYALEINPRVTTSYVGLRRATSTNLLEVMLRAVQGLDIPEIVWDRLPVTFGADGR